MIRAGIIWMIIFFWIVLGIFIGIKVQNQYEFFKIKYKKVLDNSLDLWYTK